MNIHAQKVPSATLLTVNRKMIALNVHLVTTVLLKAERNQADHVLQPGTVLVDPAPPTQATPLWEEVSALLVLTVLKVQVYQHLAQWAHTL